MHTRLQIITISDCWVVQGRIIAVKLNSQLIGGGIKANNLLTFTHLSKVLDEVQSSNRILYPTSDPRQTSISSDTRCATDMAATLLGWVHATPFLLNLALTHSRHHWGICKFHVKNSKLTLSLFCFVNWSNQSNYWVLIAEICYMCIAVENSESFCFITSGENLTFIYRWTYG